MIKIKQLFHTSLTIINNTVPIKNLSLQDSTLYKGLAIIMIVLHNFSHGIPPQPQHNEFSFSASHWNNYIDIIFKQPEYILQATFSYFGHYGVQIFLFLSAYGLTKQYLKKHQGYYSFIKHRILKIYPAFLLSILLLAIYMSQLQDINPITFIQINWESLIYKLTFISNFINGELVTIVGPWWFISLIVQFYFIFPLLIKIFEKYGSFSLIVISLFGIILTAQLQPFINISLGGTVLAHLPEFSLGIYLAKNTKVSISIYQIIIIVIVFYIANLYKTFWYVSDLTALLILLLLFQGIILKLKNNSYAIILFIGSISMYIFYINGFLREPLLQAAKNTHNWFLILVITIGFLGIVLFFSYILNLLEQSITDWLTRSNAIKNRFLKLLKIFLLFTLLVNLIYYINKNIFYIKPVFIKTINNDTSISTSQTGITLQYKKGNPPKYSKAGIILSYSDDTKQTTFSIFDLYPNTNYPNRIVYKVLYQNKTIFKGDVGDKYGTDKHYLHIEFLPYDKNITILMEAQSNIESNWGWGDTAKIKIDFRD